MSPERHQVQWESPSRSNNGREDREEVSRKSGGTTTSNAQYQERGENVSPRMRRVTKQTREEHIENDRENEYMWQGDRKNNSRNSGTTNAKWRSQVRDMQKTNGTERQVVNVSRGKREMKQTITIT
jgi:hypothetical protein